MLSHRRFSIASVAFSFWVGLVILSFFCALSPVMRAQLSTTATIGGTVTDATGALVPNATVTVQNQGTKTSTTLQSMETAASSLPACRSGLIRSASAARDFRLIR